MPPLLLTCLILTALLLAFAAAVVWWMLHSAAAESPESDPERDGGRPEAAIAADADRTAAAIISPESSRLLPTRSTPLLAPVITLRRVCSWCAVVLQEGTGPTTHGICPACAALKMAEMEREWSAQHPHTAHRPAVATL